MATAAKIAEPVRIEFAGWNYRDHAMSFSTNRQAIIILSDGTEHEMPIGAKEMRGQYRLCGDYYCFIHGPVRQVSDIGDTLEAAFLNALVKACRK